MLTTPQGCPPSDHYGVVADLEVDGVVLGEGRGLETWDNVVATLWPPEPSAR